MHIIKKIKYTICLILIYKFTENTSNNTEDKEFLEDSENEGIWSRTQIMYFLNLRLARDEDFLNPRIRKTQLWQEIAKEYSAKGYGNISAHRLEKKFSNLKITYMNNVHKKNTDERITWEFFPIMDQILNWSQLDKPKLSNTLPKQHEITFEDESVDFEPIGESSLFNINTGSKNDKLSLQRAKFEWKKRKVEALEKAEKDKIRAIKDLASAIRELSRNRNM